MPRILAVSLVLALFGFAALGEDRNSPAASGQQQQQQSQQEQDQAGQDAEATDAAQPAAGREAEGAAAGAAKDPAQMFVMDAYSGNLFEIQSGQLVAQKAQDDQIKQFARMLVQDHTRANQKLKQIAQSANIQVQERLDPVHQAKLQKMRQCPPSELGRKFVFGQVGGHTVNVLEYQYQSQNAQNDQVKQYAAQTLPKLQQHLKHATDLAMQQVGGAEARPAGGRIEGQGAADRETDAGADADAGASDASGTSGQAGQSDRNQPE